MVAWMRRKKTPNRVLLENSELSHFILLISHQQLQLWNRLKSVVLDQLRTFKGTGAQMRWQQGPNRVLLVNDKLSICMTEGSTHFPPISWNMGCLRQARATRWQFKAKWGPFGDPGALNEESKDPKRSLTGHSWAISLHLSHFQERSNNLIPPRRARF